MNKKKFIFPMLSLCFVLTACGGGTGNTSSENSESISSSEEISFEEQTSIFEGYVSLDDAIKNTKYYELRNEHSESKLTIETYFEDNKIQ